jgi:hypothetical protein
MYNSVTKKVCTFHDTILIYLGELPLPWGFSILLIYWYILPLCVLWTHMASSALHSCLECGLIMYFSGHVLSHNGMCGSLNSVSGRHFLGGMKVLHRNLKHAFCHFDLRGCRCHCKLIYILHLLMLEESWNSTAFNCNTLKQPKW